MARLMLPALLVMVLGACATASSAPEPAASPPFSLAAQCERNGGRWHPDKGVCEYPSPGLPGTLPGSR